MKIHVFYKHESGNRIEYTLTRQQESDPVYIQFTPENGEDYPFPDEENPIAFERILEMATEYAQMETALNTLGVETEESNEAE